MISARDLTFGYGSSFTLQDISFQMEEGAFWGIIGPNGSGKSTLLKILSKVIHGYSGTITLGQHDLKTIALGDLARKMAVVGSEAQFSFPYLVRDVVLMGRIPFVGRLS